MRLVSLLAVFSLVVLPKTALAQLDPAKAGKIASEMEERENAIRKEYGMSEDEKTSNADRKANMRKLSAAQQREMNEKLSSARQDVLSKNETSEKDFQRGMMKLGRDGQTEMNKAKTAETAKRAEEAKKAADAKKGGEKSGEVVVQHGLDDPDAPAAGAQVTKEGGVTVERGSGRPSGGESYGTEIPVNTQ